MTHYRIHGSTFSGSIQAPPSKSHSLRAILFASMASGKSVIRQCLQSPDIIAMIKACRQFGAHITQEKDRIDIIGVSGKPSLPDDIIDAGNSGQVLRFVGALAALIDGHVVLTGDHSVRYNRPVRPLMDGLSQLGAMCVSTKGDDHAPLIIKGPIAPGRAMLDGEDSQPVSGLLMASAFLKGTTHIQVNRPGEKPWVGLTLSWFDRLGISYHHDNFEHYTVEGGQLYEGFDYTVPGDFSSMAYPMVAALLTRSDVTIKNVDRRDAQGDKKLIDALMRMGAEFSWQDDQLHIHPSPPLQGCEIDVNDFIDAVPILAVVGCFASGTTRLSNAAVARTKECDRLATITVELQKMGADITELEDGLIIQKSKLQGADLESHADHRIAMSLAVAAMVIQSESVIHDVDCVAKSYGQFDRDMKSLGSAIEVIE